MDKDTITSAEELHSLNTGDPAKIVCLHHPDTGAKPLGETKASLYEAQEKITAVLNKLIKEDVITPVELSNLGDIANSITSAVNFMEHLEKTIAKIAHLYVDVE